MSVSDCDSDFRGLLTLVITIHSEKLAINDFLLNSIQIANYLNGCNTHLEFSDSDIAITITNANAHCECSY